MKAGPASVEFRNVSMRYGAVTAVDNVNFTIEAGKLVTLLGPSGCGKTTTLRMVAGFIAPIIAPANCRAASSSASRWRARWSATPT